MRHPPGRSLLRASLAAALCALVAGCAGFGASPDPAAAGLPEAVSAQAASAAIAPGQSKDEIRSRLGKAIEIRFESGYEVWVYRDREAARGQGGRTELVVLFAPSGVVKKTRIRQSDVTAVR